MDADLSHDPKELPKMLDNLKTNIDVIIGSRYVDGINVVNWPLSRILLFILLPLCKNFNFHAHKRSNLWICCYKAMY